jgi:uncharacterized protein
MILGKIIGKSSTTEFKFAITGNAKKFQYIQILSQENFVLAQIIEIEKEREAVAHCVIIGYRDVSNVLRGLRYPFEQGVEVLEAQDEFIKEILGLKQEKSFAFIGNLDGHENLKIFLDINKLLTKHICILAKSGSGKSYVVGVLLEELLERNVPVVVIDPHGEYSTLKLPNDDKKDIENLQKINLKPAGYLKKIIEFSPDIESNIDSKPLKLDTSNLTPHELIKMLPGKLTSIQLGTLYSSLNSMSNTKIDLNELLLSLELQESNAKWTLINIIEYIQKLNLFSDIPTQINEIVQSGKLSIINLRGVQQDIQEIIVYKLLNDMFIQRKKGNIPPFFLVIEEAHNYIPERSFGETKSSGVIRQIFSEGRKFGLGACLISQRPSRVDKSAISQCSTQIILKTSNPNDVRAISNSVEGITQETEKEIVNLPIGTALITGIVDLPLLVNIRPRTTRHGGTAVKILDETNEKKENEEINKSLLASGEIIPLINQKITQEDFKIIYGVKQVKIKLVPCMLVNCYKDGEFNLLINLHNGHIINELENGTGVPLTANKTNLTPKESRIFYLALGLKSFTAAEIFSKSGVNFSEIYDMLNLLTNKGYLVKNENKYAVNEKFSHMADLREYRLYEKIDYNQITFDQKLESAYNADELKDLIGKFVKVKDSKDCFLVLYE